jgi:hypothetical protein
MQDFVDDNFVFWMGTLLFAEGYNASSLLRASGFPYLAVITTIDNQTTVCDAHEGLVCVCVCVCVCEGGGGGGGEGDGDGLGRVRGG